MSAVQPSMADARDVDRFLVALVDKVVDRELRAGDPTSGVGEPAATFGRAEALEWPHQEALRIAAARGEVRRSDLITRCGISRESARKYFVGLVSAVAL